MNTHFTLPTHPPKRDSMLCIRLTREERHVIQLFANQVQQPISRLARHFILQAIQQHQLESEIEEGGVGDEA